MKHRKHYKVLTISNKRPLDTQLRKMGFEGYVRNWQLKPSRKKDRQSLYKGNKKMFEVYW